MGNSKRKLILHIPHSSTKIPDMTGFELNLIELFKEMDILTDRSSTAGSIKIDSY